MRLFLNGNYYITRFHSRELVSFTVEYILLSIRSTFINLDINDFLFFDNFFTIAVLAFVFLINLFTLSIAFITRTCSLRIHSRSKHLHDSSHTFTITSFTCLDSASLTSSAFTLRTNSVSAHGNFCIFAII